MRHGHGLGVSDQIFLGLATAKSAGATVGPFINHGHFFPRLVEESDAKVGGGTGADYDCVENLVCHVCNC